MKKLYYKNISLNPYQLKHYEKTVHWLNNSEIRESFGLRNEISYKGHLNWVQNLSDTIIWAIHEEEFDNYIGNILLFLNKKHNSGFLQIYIGEIVNRGKKFGENALRCLINFVFNELKLNRLWLKVFEENKIAINLYNKVGFKFEGVERQSFYNGENFRNQLIFSILKEEWGSKI
ncbi:GNAT family N-acetyltransferase [Lysinibacillus sp. NPDC056959]|uniref:GNAT family N-acetyltransferase n=1 Tax=Lysinibacillus sp. NPDC056959 TaxID=3345981 RepID=UPI003631B04F